MVSVPFAFGYDYTVSSDATCGGDNPCFRTLVRRKEWSAVLQFFISNPENLSRSCSGNGTPLHLISMYNPPRELVANFLEVYSYTKLLQDHHSNIEVANHEKDQNQWTPLHIASAFLSHEVITCVLQKHNEHTRLFLEKGLKRLTPHVLEVADPKGRTPLFVLTQCYGRKIKRHMFDVRAYMTTPSIAQQQDSFKSWVLNSLNVEEDDYDMMVSKKNPRKRNKGEALQRIKPPNSRNAIFASRTDLSYSVSSLSEEEADSSSEDESKTAGTSTSVRKIMETTNLCLYSLSLDNSPYEQHLHLHNTIQCSRHFPNLNLIRLALWKNPEQALINNANGDLPIHIACQAPGIVKYDAAHDMYLDYPIHDEKHLHLSSQTTPFTVKGVQPNAPKISTTYFYPRENAIGLMLNLDSSFIRHDRAPLIMARQLNRRRQLPMHLAISSGKSFFNGGLYLLWEAFPDSLKVPDPQTNLFPFMMAASVCEKNQTYAKDDAFNFNRDTDALTTVYCLLRACPELERFSSWSQY